MGRALVVIAATLAGCGSTVTVDASGKASSAGAGEAETVGAAASTGGGVTGGSSGAGGSGGGVASIGSDAPCLVGGNVLYLEGDPGNYVVTGAKTVTAGNWGTMSTPAAVSIYNWQKTEAWAAGFESPKAVGLLQTQVYTNVGGYPSKIPDQAGEEIDGDEVFCDEMTSGQFQVEEIVFEGDTLKRFTATFEEFCDGSQAMLRGCVHFEQ